MQNEELDSWVLSIATHVRPSNIHWCDGSDAEIRWLQKRMVAKGALAPLDPDRYPRSFLHRSHRADVARAESSSFLCTEQRVDAGPTNTWMSEEDANQTVWPLFAGAMTGKTLFVVPYLLGPRGSRYSRVGVQLTDSPYVVASLRLMTRMGKAALEHCGSSADLVRGLHCTGDLSTDRRYVVHFPSTKTIWSIGSGYGDSAILGTKYHAICMASVQARNEGWLAERMLIMELTDPEGSKHYIAVARPGAGGNASLSMLVQDLPGWTVKVAGDDVCWMHVGEDGQLWAINPLAGMSGVVPGTSLKENPSVELLFGHDVLFTNTALQQDGTPWWEGMGEEPREGLVDWRGHPWSASSPEKAAHPDARFTVAASQCPFVTGAIHDPRGVPISAIVFAGGGAEVAPLVYEATSWAHGVYIGATLLSQTAPAAVPRNDPMGMLSCCGYNMGDYFAHWLSLGARLRKAPRVFHVNWLRADRGKLLWPGLGHEARVLKWIVQRVQRNAPARITPIGFVPIELDVAGLGLSAEQIQKLHEVDLRAWSEQMARNQEFLARFGSRLPEPLRGEHDGIVRRLKMASN
ncbi:phosphoenolpyruvate carboxykinase (GTP) [Sorangium sp. KYC3313]|uniref:phosphoenolpyruvate carboxykinase (GTP) n=1 Tax=Sorangium sp. KYC3313 TaxID=3449740 RepID=UPI003F88FBE4